MVKNSLFHNNSYGTYTGIWEEIFLSRNTKFNSMKKPMWVKWSKMERRMNKRESNSKRGVYHITPMTFWVWYHILILIRGEQNKIMIKFREKMIKQSNSILYKRRTLIKEKRYFMYNATIIVIMGTDCVANYQVYSWKVNSTYFNFLWELYTILMCYKGVRC